MYICTTITSFISTHPNMYTYILQSLNDLDNICRKKREYNNSLRIFHKTFKTTKFYMYVYLSKIINKTEIMRFD